MLARTMNNCINILYMYWGQFEKIAV